MLQVITGMYFRDVRLNETEHRWTLYTNARFLGAERVDLPLGHLTPATDWSGVNVVDTVMATVVERLEAVRPNGEDDFMVSTGGTAIAEDLAIVLSFALNATFTTRRETADRLILEPSASPHRPNPADILPRTFTPGLLLNEADVRDLAGFMTSLLALHRSTYEKAIRAMQRIVTASERVAEDPTLAYTDYVAALESLSADAEGPRLTWDRLDPRKRRILEPALHGVTADQDRRLRMAILDAERAGIKNRYIEFVLSHVRPTFFRQEAVNTVRPITEPALRQAVSKAYDARSKNVHELRELGMGTWLLVGGAQTAEPVNDSLMMTHAGLDRLARHVVRTYVERGSTVIDRTYSWRDHLPNVIQVKLAPSLYLGHADALGPVSAAARASDFLGLLIEALSERENFSVDMRPVLGRVEELLETQRSPAVRAPMLAMYLLWHRLFPEEVHRPDPHNTMETAANELQGPSMFSFITGLLLGYPAPPWSVDEFCDLAEDRFADLRKRRPFDLPARVDSALWIYVADVLWQNGTHDLACAAIARAVECTPGHEGLLQLELDVLGGRDIKFDVRAFVLATMDLETDSDNSKETSPL